MKHLVLVVLLCGVSPAMAQDPAPKLELDHSEKAELKDAPASGKDFLASYKEKNGAAPACILFDLEKNRSIAVPLCGQSNLSVEVGAPDSPMSIGQLTVQRMKRLKWFKPVFIAIGKAVWKVSTVAEKKAFEQELNEFRAKYPCDNQ